jgi:hypothetical protein
MRVVIVILSFVAMIILICMLCRASVQSKFKYTIEYNHAKYSCEDYTNEFEYLPGGSTIRYINENGDSIYRTGTFSIEKN